MKTWRSTPGALALALGVMLAVLGLGRRAEAHILRGTAVFLDVGASRLDVELQIPLDQLAMALPGREFVRGDRLVDAAAADQYIAQHLHLNTPDGRPFNIEVRSRGVERIVDGDCLVVRAAATPPPGTSLERFDVATDVVLHQVASHRIYVLVRHDFRNGAVEGEPRLVGIIKYQVPVAHVVRQDRGLWRGLWAVYRLGMRHIRDGSDHVLFLLMLLLTGPIVARGGRWGAAGEGGLRHIFGHTLRVVTAFTVGHSITLAVGASGLFAIRDQTVEVLIALSILLAAIHALRPIFPNGEAIMAGGFGLVHGLAFSTVLRSFGFDAGALVWSVVMFNLGVETMQVLVVAAVMPLLYLASRSPRFRLLRIAGAAAGVVIAVGWLAERGPGWPGPDHLRIERLAQLVVWAALLAWASLSDRATVRVIAKDGAHCQGATVPRW